MINPRKEKDMKATIARLHQAAQAHYHLTDEELIQAFENGADDLDITDTAHIVFWNENIDDITKYICGDPQGQETEYDTWYTILMDYGTDSRKCVTGIVESWYIIECVGSWLSGIEED
jgi:hypothetical protein